MIPVENLIADFHERSLPNLTPRQIHMPRITGKANVIIGMRRSGKTYYMYQEMDQLISEGVNKTDLLYLNFEDDRLNLYAPQFLDNVLETFFRMNPHARSRQSYLFLDEIQIVPDWERFVRRVLDTENARIYISGSSAKMLATEVASVLRGRGISIEVLPFSLTESAIHAGLEIPDKWPPGSRLRSHLEAHIQSYLDQGGFPEVQGIDDQDRTRILQDYVEIVLFRDVIERHGIENITAAKVFTHTILQMTGKLFSVNKTYRHLKSQGLKISKDTLHALVNHLSDAYLVFLIPIFRQSPKARSINPRKVYIIDPGLARAMSHEAATDRGTRLENAVYLELRRRLDYGLIGQVSYYKSQSGREIDFIIGNPTDGSVKQVIQVCESIENSETRQREILALQEGMEELRVSDAIIVTLRQEETLQTSNGIIQIIPAWKWFFQK